MKNLRILLGLAVAVAAGALLFNIVSGSHFEWQNTNGSTRVNIQIGSPTGGHANGLLGVVSVILLVMLVAFYATSIHKSAPESTGGFFDFLRKLTTSNRDRMIGGVCGGLGQHTSVPSWVWRLGFVAMVLCYGTGLGAYILLWIFVPDERPRVERPADETESAAA